MSATSIDNSAVKGPTANLAAKLGERFCARFEDHCRAAVLANGFAVVKSGEFYGVDLASVDALAVIGLAKSRGILAEFGPGMLGGVYLTLRMQEAGR